MNYAELTADKLKIIPFPQNVKLGGNSVKIKPFASSAEGAIGCFLPKDGDCEVLFSFDEQFPSEAYGLKIADGSVEITASTYAGRLYGAVTLDMLVKQFGNELPEIEIFDEPLIAHRGTQLSYGQINVEYRGEWLKQHIVELCKMRINYLYLYLEFDYAFPSLPPICGKGMMTPKDAKEITEFAKLYNIKIIPQANFLGHTADLLAVQLLNGLKENDDANSCAKTSTGLALCPNNPQVLKTVFAAIDDLVDAFSPEIIHIGGDEVSVVGGDEYCKDQMEKLGKTGVLLSYFIKLRDYIAAKGIKTGIWGDMLLALSDENRYDGNLCDEKYIENNLKLFEELKKDTLIYDWWYVGASEKSIKFFTEKGFNVISSASVHGCMTSIPSFDQQMNIRALFIDAVKYKVAGGLICDWIYGLGYHGGTQGCFNVAAGACMLWSGTDKNCFIRNCPREKFEKDYLFVRYKTTDAALTEYYHLAGDIRGELLNRFPANKKGVALRKVLFYTDNPMWCYIKYSPELDGRLDDYGKTVEKLSKLYKRAEKTCADDGYFYSLKVAAIVHEYILKVMKTFDEFYDYYDAAAKAQYTDAEKFEKNLDACAETLSELLPAYSEPIRYAEWLNKKLGTEASSAYRIRGARKNLKKLIRYMTRLKENYRPLPTLARLSESLFDTDTDTWWKMRDYEWINEKGEFRKYDVDLCRFYEALEWDV